MHLLGIALLAQLAAPAHQTLPVLEFPEAGIDDSASYRGYRTRFLRDAANNTVQIYLDRRDGRVVNLWADAEDESIGFTARTARGTPASVRWSSEGARVGTTGRSRFVEYDLVADDRRLAIGWFLLGSMRVERDLQYSGKHLTPFSGPRFSLSELDRLVTALGQLPAADARAQLKVLNAASLTVLRGRLRPVIVLTRGATTATTRVTQLTLDGRDTISLEIRTDRRVVASARAGDSLTLRATSGGSVPFTVRIATTGKALTPLAREEIFNASFLQFLADARQGANTGRAATSAASLRARRLERQVRGVELLASREKLMAGLPTYATYFGRDMMMTALMMRSIWRDEMSEFAIASVLRKLGPAGDVSHEEALGGQAVREGASEYAALVGQSNDARAAGRIASADSLLARARTVLRDLRVTRENYHMIDDEFQFAVLTARWLADPDVLPAHKRAFLLDSADSGEPRLGRLIRELGLVTRMTSAYAANPTPMNLVSFARRDSTWGSASWRDSGAGYAGGRYAMDINAIWAPQALASVARILSELRVLGFSVDSLAARVPDLAPSTPLGRYARDARALDAAVATWQGASRHFVVRLAPADVQSRVMARLAAMPAEEREYWTSVVSRTSGDRDSLTFLAIALDSAGRPIAVANTDPATGLFLGSATGTSVSGDSAAVLRDVRLFVRHYPVGLLIEQVGPVVANDAYAPPRVWDAFVRDPYHGPRVVWGREINLFLLGAANRIATASAERGAPDAYTAELRAAIDRVQAAVQASGFHSELWSYDVTAGRVVPARYGTGADVQLWSTTDLAVQFALSRLPR